MAIVGAGAAGLATAIFIRRLNAGVSVLLMDGSPRPGAKILISGGSRCNVTNVAVSDRDYCGARRTIIRRVLRALPVADTVAWFATLGVALHEETHGKLFPDSNRSRDVLDALLRELTAAGATLLPATRVVAVHPDGGVWRLETSNGPRYARSVVMATGGQSVPRSGSDGLGYEIARRLGHRVVPTTPALVPLVLADAPDALHHGLTGVAHPAELSLWIEGRISERLSGDLLWTHFGISGPVVLDTSRHWLRAVLEQRPARLTLRFCPGHDFDSLLARWAEVARERPRATIQSTLAGLVPASVAVRLLSVVSIDPSLPLAHFPREDRRRLAHALVEWPLHVTGSRGYNYAEATSGGVALDGVDPDTLQSRHAAGLYFVGEVLDVDGRLGGFNFQWAWASARVAAEAIARGGA